MARPRQISDEQILTTMRECVLSRGPSVALHVVAHQLAVSVPALLKRFGNRQALMLAALQSPSEPAWIKALEDGPGKAKLDVQLHDIFTSIFAFMQEAIPCITALRESGLPPQACFSKTNGPERGLKTMQRWLRRARKLGLVTASELDSAAFAMLGAIQNRAFFSHVLKMKFSDADQREYVRDLARFFTRALTP